MSVSGFEFSSDQNKVIGSLASKMNFVGHMAVALGALNLLMALLVIAAVYRDRIPADWKAKGSEYMTKARDALPAEMRSQADQYSLDKLPANNHLWGIVLSTGASGLFFVMLGIWTRTTAVYFHKIATTQGSDIRNLMGGIDSLLQMYSFLYSLLLIVLVAAALAILLTLYKYYGG